MYIERDLERKFELMNANFKAILLTGARQVGKTTMLKNLSKKSNRTYVTLDDANIRDLAKTDPKLFFQTYKTPILIDEIQKAPELFEYIKIICDESDEKGIFWLTGSEQFKMMKKVSETLAGRICILNLYSLSQKEISEVKTDELTFSLDSLKERQKLFNKNNILNVYNFIWNGGMPDVQNKDSEIRNEYFNSYIETYLMKDIMEFGGISDTVRFSKFLKISAALISQQVNYKTLAENADISEPTAKSWLNILEGLGIIYLLRPFENNALKRLTKTPKLYFCDTGLASYLSMWLTPDTLMNGAASGAFFENYVVMELIKNFAYSKNKVDFFYYRDSNAKEINLFLIENNIIHPFEIKKSASPDKREIKKYNVIDKSTLKKGYGGIICMSDEVLPIDEENCYLPCNII